jgi:hypothetical protein
VISFPRAEIENEYLARPMLDGFTLSPTANVALFFDEGDGQVCLSWTRQKADPKPGGSPPRRRSRREKRSRAVATRKPVSGPDNATNQRPFGTRLQSGALGSCAVQLQGEQGRRRSCSAFPVRPGKCRYDQDLLRKQVAPATNLTPFALCARSRRLSPQLPIHPPWG